MKEKVMFALLVLLSACNIEMKEPTPEPTPESTPEPTPATYPTDTDTYYPMINYATFNVNHLEISEIYLSASEIINFNGKKEMRSYYTVYGINIDTLERECIADDISESDISDYHIEWILIPGQKVVEIYRSDEDPYLGTLIPVKSFEGWY